jgi:hypothetical protein
MAIDTDRIDDAVLALLYLTLRDQHLASKGFDRAALDRLHEKGMIESPAASPESVTFTPDGLQRSKQLLESLFVSRPAEAPASEAPRTARSAKYPDIRVELADLGRDMYPILRRVSYAMSDAGVDDDDIEQYKSEVKASKDPVGVSRRWVSVG